MAPGPEAQRSNAPAQATRGAAQSTQYQEQAAQIDRVAQTLIQHEYEQGFLHAAKRENPEVARNIEALRANLEKLFGELKPPLTAAQKKAIDLQLEKETLSARVNGETAWKTSLSDAQQIYNSLNGGLFGRNDEPKVMSILSNKSPAEFANISLAYEHYVKTYAGKWTSSELNLAAELRDELSSDAQVRLQRLLSPEAQHKTVAQMQAERIQLATESNSLFSRLTGYKLGDSILSTYRDSVQRDQNGEIAKAATAKQVGDLETAYKALTGNGIEHAVGQLNSREQKLIQAYRKGDGTEIASRELEVTLKVPSSASPDDKGNYLAAQNQNVVDRKAFFSTLEALSLSGTENLNRVAKLFEANVGKSIQTVANETWGEGSVLAKRTSELLEGQIISSRASAFEAGRRSGLMTLFGDKEEVKSVISPFRTDNDTLALAVALRADQGFQNDVRLAAKVNSDARITDAHLGKIAQDAEAGNPESKQLISRAHAIFAKQRGATITNGDEEWEYKVALRGEPTTTAEAMMRAKLYQDRYGNRFGNSGEKRFVQDQFADLLATAQDLDKNPDNGVLNHRAQTAAIVFTSGSRSLAENERNFSNDVKNTIPMGVGAAGAVVLTASGVGTPLGIALIAGGTGAVSYGGMKTADYLLSGDESIRFGNLGDIGASAESAAMVGGIGFLGRMASTSKYVAWASEVSPLSKSPLRSMAGAGRFGARVVSAGDGALQGILIGAPAGGLVGGAHGLGQALTDPDLPNMGVVDGISTVGTRTLNSAANGALTGAAFGATGGALYRFARPVTADLGSAAPNFTSTVPPNRAANFGTGDVIDVTPVAPTAPPGASAPAPAPAPAPAQAPAPAPAPAQASASSAPAPSAGVANGATARVAQQGIRPTDAGTPLDTPPPAPEVGSTGSSSSGRSRADFFGGSSRRSTPAFSQQSSVPVPNESSAANAAAASEGNAASASTRAPSASNGATAEPAVPPATARASSANAAESTSASAPVNGASSELTLFEKPPLTGAQEKTVANIIEKFRRSFFPLQSEVSSTGTINAEFRTVEDFVKFVKTNHPELKDAVLEVLEKRIPVWEELAADSATEAASGAAQAASGASRSAPGFTRRVVNRVVSSVTQSSAQSVAIGTGVIIPLGTGKIALSQLRGSDNTSIPLNPGFGVGTILPATDESPQQVLAKVAAAAETPSAGGAPSTDAPTPEPARPTVAFGSLIQDAARANNMSPAIVISIMAQHYSLENKQLDLNAAVDSSALAQVQATVKGIREDIEKNQPNLVASLANPADEGAAKAIFNTYFSSTSRDAAGALMPQSLLELVGPSGRDALVLQALETYKAVKAGGTQTAPAEEPQARQVVEQPPVATATLTPATGDGQPVAQLSQASLPPAPAPAQLAVAAAELSATRAAETNTEAVENIVRQSYIGQGRNNPFRNLFTEKLQLPFTPARELSFDPAFRRTESFAAPSQGNLSLNLSRGITLGSLQSPRNGLGSGMNIRFMPAQSAVVAETDEV